MKKLLLLITVCGLITLSKAAEQDGIRLRALGKPQAAKCTWKPNRPPSEFTDPTKQIAGLLTFWDASGKQIRSIDYNPITREIRYLKGPKNLHSQSESIRKQFPTDTLKAIGTELGLDVTYLDETECNQSIAAWLPKKEQGCSIQ